MINVEMKFYGPVRDIIKQDEFEFQVPAPYTGESAFEALVSLHPELRRWRTSLKLAVNLEYVPFDHPLRAGDEVSFIPPVSGG